MLELNAVYFRSSVILVYTLFINELMVSRTFCSNRHIFTMVVSHRCGPKLALSVFYVVYCRFSVLCI